MGLLKLQNYCKKKKSRLYTSLVRGDFGSIGKGSVINPPFHSHNASKIHIGENVRINSYSWLECVPQYGGRQFPDHKIEIGDGAYFGHRTHLIACSHMVIGKNVVVADGVYITDNLHGYEDVSKPILPQALEFPGKVVIEDEVWLGDGVCVLPNVTIGRHSVIGSNSVVTKDIPPYSVAVGSPAKVIKQYDFDKKQWIRV